MDLMDRHSLEFPFVGSIMKPIRTRTGCGHFLWFFLIIKNDFVLILLFSIVPYFWISYLFTILSFEAYCHARGSKLFWKWLSVINLENEPLCETLKKKNFCIEEKGTFVCHKKLVKQRKFCWLLNYFCYCYILLFDNFSVHCLEMS